MPTNAVAPVCHISNSETLNPEQQPSARSFAAIPQANDLASALAAIAALTQNMNQMSNRLGGRQQAGAAGQAGKAGAPGKAGKDAKSGHWAEVNRATTTVKIVSDGDAQTFITVRRTSSITLRNSTTGETMVIQA